MTFYVDNEVNAEFDFDIDKLALEVAEEVLRCEDFNYDAECSLVITDDEGIHEMNRDFRGIDSPTDVLSFPGVGFEEPGDYTLLESGQGADYIDPDTDCVMLGDIVINEKRVRSQAEEYGHSEKREFAFLVAHSMLHLLGYDHMEEEEARVMEEKQDRALSNLGIVRE